MGYVLNKSYGSWSAGTVVDILSPSREDVKKWEETNTVNHGYATVRTRSPQASGQYETFDIPIDYLTKRRERAYNARG